ncbi:MAG: ribosome small subunit-dependent GTPase A [Thermoflavifilum sp.]|nr:ribosome small subunit-dependent GTPase A [Thermoflavifilum sp.]MCL6513316.1 ribosome small subunit-dependent GTPase A [Alicyclobacillus sp.]
MQAGRVIRAVGGLFDVKQDGVVRRCRARGVFKKRGITVMVGDLVEVEPVGASEGVINAVLPRQTELIRPPVANVDQALCVFSLRTPDFHARLLDRVLVCAQAARVRPVIVISKVDTGDEDELRRAAEPYERAGYTVIPASAWANVGIDQVREVLRGHITVFAGPSGAGKSSLANALSPELGLRMGDVSRKLGRGRHTTRHVELFELEPDTWIADAPGFSQLELTVASSELRDYFPEIREVGLQCEYDDCLHLEETGCAVKHAVASGELAASRYESYRTLLLELLDKEAHRY